MNRRRIPIVGGSSLLVIFAVLCLTVFALLGLSTVRADQRLSDASAEAVSAYYEAECAAERILAELRSGALPSGVHTDGDIYSYVCTISDTRELRVAVQVDGAKYEILQWRVASTLDWETETLHIWNGVQGETE